LETIIFMGLSIIYSNVNISHVERLPEAAAGHFPTTPMAHCPEISIAGFDEIGPTENVNLEEDVASWHGKWQMAIPK
jgi:hypothetical protein